MKPRAYKIDPPATPKLEIVVSREGRNLKSMPKSKRRAAKKAAEDALKRPDWAVAHEDPEEQRHYAHRASNSRRRGTPTKGAQKRDAIRRSTKD